MDLVELKEHINQLIKSLESNDKRYLEGRLKELVSVFPFNEYEYILIYLRDKKLLTFQDYELLRKRYVNTNQYLGLYEISPRVFGQVWGEQHLMEVGDKFKKPDKRLDPKYSGEYDLWFDGIKLEIKACRAINTKKRGALVSKALCYSSQEPFWMNFQQLKPDAAHVFIFIGVWVDQIIYWVMSYREVNECDYLSHQHRGGIEYQIGITNKNVADFDIYRVSRNNLIATIIKKSKPKH